ncbi:MAG: PEP-CTERM sorting domain-containing protein, partial [Gemmataceae bacterium]
NLPGNTTNKRFLVCTASLPTFGGPSTDFVMPNNFLFSAGGTINFFGANGGAYTSLPIDGSLSRNWTGGNALNSPTNFAGATGLVTPVPEPGSMLLVGAAAAGMFTVLRRRVRGLRS